MSGWGCVSPTRMVMFTRWAPAPHPEFGLLKEFGVDVPPVFFLKFRYPVQTAATFGKAEPQAVSSPVITWISRN